MSVLGPKQLEELGAARHRDDVEDADAHDAAMDRANLLCAIDDLLAAVAEVTRERDEERRLQADALFEQHHIGRAAGFEEAREAGAKSQEQRLTKTLENQSMSEGLHTDKTAGGLSIAGLEEMASKLRVAGARPTAILVRRDVWPAFKAELEAKCNEANSVDVAGPFGPAFVAGIPIRVVAELPRPWMILHDDLAATEEPSR